MRADVLDAARQIVACQGHTAAWATIGAPDDWKGPASQVRGDVLPSCLLGGFLGGVDPLKGRK